MTLKVLDIPVNQIDVGAIEKPQEERIGKFRVHPVAAMFPLMQGSEWDEFRDSIEVYGQLKPIVVQGDLLLDGRNRIKACIELGLTPRTVEYQGKLDVVDYILTANIDRRHMGEDCRVAVCGNIQLWRIARDNAARQKEARAVQGQHGAEGGRGKKKPLNMNSYSRVSESKTRAMKNARSTVGQIAEVAKVSHYKAAQAVAVAKAAPDLLDQVKTGAMKLKDAFARVRAAAPPKPVAADKLVKSRTFHVGKRVEKCSYKISDWIAQCPVSKRVEFKSLLFKECERLCRK